MSEWQPIETAPMNGTWVMIYCPGGIGVAVAAYMTLDIDWWHIDNGKDEYPVRGPAPTHWMPLPDPPPEAK